MKGFKRYLLNWLIHFDQGLNVLLGGSPDETVSSRAYRLAPHYKLWAALAWFLDRIHTNHSEWSHEPDEGKNDVFWIEPKNDG